tara:strand:+ start:1598 stop:2677 length:1080 start_codon:yes stop_codon:yes gene_type:complete
VSNPYKNLEQMQYWSSYRKGILKDNLITDIWQPKFEITSQSQIATFGSCFAQHISNALRCNGYNWVCTENLPVSVSDDLAKELGYRNFSCRTGNIYTTSMLNQWVDWSLDIKDMPPEIWLYKGRYYDPIRPNIENVGFESLEECRAMREVTKLSFARCVKQADVFVFTLGLTEAWVNKDMGYEYPICPQALKMSPPECQSEFINYDYERVKANLVYALEKIRQVNPNIKILLTVSPVPLIATHLPSHVMVATSAAKSILRAVCDSVKETSNCIDYFPSYEIISNPFSSTDFFALDKRSVTTEGVTNVMQYFFDAIGDTKSGQSKVTNNIPLNQSKDNFDQTICEEELLLAFIKEQGLPI